MPTARGPDPAAEEHFLGALYRGGELLATGKIIEAREHLEKAHELEPKNEKAQNLLGLTYFKLGLFDLAAQVYEKLVLENPTDPTLRVNLGLVFLKTNDLERSVREFETATDLEPGHKKAHNYLGLALAQKGDYARARDNFLLAGSEPMAEKMERALETRTSASAATATTEVSLSPMPSSEPQGRPLPPDASTLPEAQPPPPPPDDAEPFEPSAAAAPLAPEPKVAQTSTPNSGAVASPAEPAPAAELPPSLASNWAEHVPEAPVPVPEFRIEETPALRPPPELQFTDDEHPASMSMNDAPLIPVDGTLEPVDVKLEGLPQGDEPLPVLESSAVEMVVAPSQEAAEASMWLTEHVADVPLGSPAPRAEWGPSPWVGSDAEAAAAGPEWIPSESDGGWTSEVPGVDPGAPASMWPGPGPGTEPDGAAWHSAPTPIEVHEPDERAGAAPTDDPSSGVAPLEAGEPYPSWEGSTGQAEVLPQAPPVDESNWVMQPVSEAFSADVPRAYESQGAWPQPAPSTGFVPMPTQRLAELGQVAPWTHEATADPFQLGPQGLAVTVAGQMLVRMENLVAVVGGLTVAPEARRRRGRPTNEPFGDSPSQLHRLTGHGVVYLEPMGQFHSLDLTDQPATAVDDEGAYLREDLVFGFEESVSFDNGRLTDEAGLSLELVHLKGWGKVLLRLEGMLKAMPVPPGTPTMVPLSRLVGWFGRLTPRLVGFGGQGAVELTGDGFALLLT